MFYYYILPIIYTLLFFFCGVKKERRKVYREYIVENEKVYKEYVEYTRKNSLKKREIMHLMIPKKKEKKEKK